MSGSGGKLIKVIDIGFQSRIITLFTLKRRTGYRGAVFILQRRITLRQYWSNNISFMFRPKGLVSCRSFGLFYILIVSVSGCFLFWGEWNPGTWKAEPKPDDRGRGKTWKHLGHGTLHGSVLFSMCERLSNFGRGAFLMKGGYYENK
jgi:hypothetical protein